MGRKPSRWKNLPPRMRARERPYGIYYYYDAGGKPRKEIPLGTDYIEAVRQWAQLEKQNIPAFGLATFIDAADRYITAVLTTKAKRTQEDNLKELAYLREFFGNPPAPLDQIQPIHVRQYMTWRVAKSHAMAVDKNQNRIAKNQPPLPIPENHGQVRANRDKSLLSHIFNHARECGLTAAPNPCNGIKGYKETGRDTYVEDDMYGRVYQSACEPLKESMDLAYLTGQRPADVLGYSLADIKDNALIVQQGKTGRKVRIEMVGKLAELIERIKARRSTIDKRKVVSLALIVNESGQALSACALRSRFDKARKSAGVPKNEFQFRDLRAKAGTDKAESEDISAARKQLGHVSVKMTEHYVRNRKGDLVKPTK